MLNKENATTSSPKKKEQNANVPAVKETSHITVLPPLSEQLNEEICQSMNLINSSVNALHSQIQSVVKSEETNDVHYAIHKMQATSMAAKGIAELLKAKVDMMRFIAPKGRRK